MREILDKIYKYDSHRVINDILNLYERQGFAVINYVYFAIIKVQKLFESGKKTTIQKEYKKALFQGDFLLPDGIALQIFYRIAQKVFSLSTKKLHNLNGTDFLPFFTDEIKKRFGSQRICLFLYGAKADIVQDTKTYFQNKGFNVLYYQDGYSELNWDELVKSKKDYQNTINILLVARSTPTNPIQEIRTLKNYKNIKDNNMLVFNQGGTFDFLAAEINKRKGTQKRAPKFIRSIKLEWLWRLLTDPKRNYQKVKNSFAIFPYILKYLLLKKD